MAWDLQFQILFMKKLIVTARINAYTETLYKVTHHWTITAMIYCLGVSNMENEDSQGYIRSLSPGPANKNILSCFNISLRRKGAQKHPWSEMLVSVRRWDWRRTKVENPRPDSSQSCWWAVCSTHETRTCFGRSLKFYVWKVRSRINGKAIWMKQACVPE